MKSIYEAAVAYGREHQGTLNIEDFEAGANYVLDAIEDILIHPRRFVNADTSISEAMIVEITKIVEQLKETNK